eukprot:2012339-Prymnesium_polylepis.1
MLVARLKDSSATRSMPSACSARARWNQSYAVAEGSFVASSWQLRPVRWSPAVLSSQPRRESSAALLDCSGQLGAAAAPRGAPPLGMSTRKMLYTWPVHV